MDYLHISTNHSAFNFEKMSHSFVAAAVADILSDLVDTIARTRHPESQAIAAHLVDEITSSASETAATIVAALSGSGVIEFDKESDATEFQYIATVTATLAVAGAFAQTLMDVGSGVTTIFDVDAVTDVLNVAGNTAAADAVATAAAAAVYTVAMHKSDVSGTCVVCYMEDCHDTTRCDHTVCERCVKAWIRVCTIEVTSATCPLCRAVLL